jgi:hypothetical protein
MEDTRTSSVKSSVLAPLHKSTWSACAPQQPCHAIRYTQNVTTKQMRGSVSTFALFTALISPPTLNAFSKDTCSVTT